MVESGVDKMKEAQRRPGRGQKGVWDEIVPKQVGDISRPQWPTCLGDGRWAIHIDKHGMCCTNNVSIMFPLF